MRSKFFHTSTEFMLWLSSSYFTGFNFLGLAESGRYGVYYRRQLHNNCTMYWIFIALSRLNPSLQNKMW